MKKVISLLTLIILSFSAYCQFEDDLPEESESDKKTEFRHSIFQTNYLTQNILVKFLEQNCELISISSDSLKIRATDLYFDYSADFKSEEKITYWMKEKYLTSEKRKIELLDSALSISKKWKSSIIEENLLDKIIEPINRGYDFSIKNNTIYAVSPSHQNIYKFEFSKRKKIISENFGKLTADSDTLYWITSIYEYKNKLLFKKVNKRCNDCACLNGYDLETIIYNEGHITKITKQKFSRHNSDFLEEEITNYVYTNKIIDSTITSTYKIRNFKHKLDKITICKYANGNIISIEESWLSVQMFTDQKSFTVNKYDENNLLVSSEYKGWDNNNVISQIRIEEFEYLKNKYVYRYKQSLKKERGKEKLPLQYELTYTFH